MSIFDHHAFAVRFAQAMNENDRRAFETLVTTDFVTEWPQSGERIRGYANFWAIIDNYPGGLGGAGNDVGTLTARPADAVKLVAPSYTFVTVEGAGNSGVFTLKVHYPDGSDWWVITHYRLRDGRMASSTTFFAPVYPAPDWRAPWVERIT